MKRPLVPKPCLEDWDKLTPEARGHFCTVCETKVWNLSDLTKEEAEAFLRERAGEDLCVSYREDDDGRVLHREPAVVPAARLVRRFPAAAGLSLALAACTPKADAPPPKEEPTAQTEPEAEPETKPEAEAEAPSETGSAAGDTEGDTGDGPPPPEPTKPDDERDHVKGKWVPAEEPPPNLREPKKGKVARPPQDTPPPEL